jgi:rare lipoprotein A
MKLQSTCVVLCALTWTLSAAHAQSASAAAATPAPAAPSAAPAPAPAAPAAAGADATQGKIAHYGAKFNGRKTASGEVFNSSAMTMAHKTLPFGTRVKVTNIANGKSVVVRVNDRGPSTPDRVGDLTTAAARKIGMTKAGVVEAKLEVVGSAAKKK